MKTYHLRVSKNLGKVLAFLAENCIVYLCVMEHADEEVNRDHYHVHIREMKLEYQSFRDKFLKYWKPEDYVRGDYSFELVRDEKGMDNYLCKGVSLDAGYYVHGKAGTIYTGEYTDECHQAYWEINKAIEKKGYKKIKGNLIQEVADELLETKRKWEWKDTDKWLVFSCVMSHLRKKAKILDAIIIRRLCNGVLNILCPYETEKEFFHQVFDADRDFFVR